MKTKNVNNFKEIALNKANLAPYSSLTTHL